jgi:hypothetical protein
MSLDPLTPGRRQRFQSHQIHPDRRKSEAFQILTGTLLGQIQGFHQIVSRQLGNGQIQV